MFWDFLYGLSLKDEVSQAVIQRRARVISAAAAATTVSATDDPVPTDNVFVLTNVCVDLFPGGALTTNGFRIEVRDETGAVMTHVLRESFAAIAGDAFNWQGEVLLMPSERLECDAFFSAATSSNTVALSIHGYMLPRGNLQRG